MTKSEIQLVRSLADKRGRTEQGLFVAEGEKLIGELRASRWRIRKIFALEEVFEGPEVETVTTRDMERLSLLKTANNSLALVEIPHRDFRIDDLDGRLSIALDEVRNPGNLGTIIRLADWFGVEHIICSQDTADVFSPKTVQATMGALVHVKVHYTDLHDYLKKQAEQQIPLYGTFLDGENMYAKELSETGIIIMGNEGNGIRPEIETLVNEKLYIPNYPQDRETSESLNVAIATAVVCAEFRRRRGNAG